MVPKPAMHRQVLLVLGLPTLLFVLAVLGLQVAGLQPMDTDSHRYVAGARALLEKGSLMDTAADGTPRLDPIRTPGYPLILALMGWIYEGVNHPITNLKLVCFQAALWWFAILTLIRVTVGWKPIHRPWLAGIGLVATLLAPAALVSSGQLMTDIPFAAFLTLGCSLLAVAIQRIQGQLGQTILGRQSAKSYRRIYLPALAAGLLLGFASSIRPVGTEIPFLLAATVGAWYCWAMAPSMRRRIRNHLLGVMALTVTVATIPPALWTLRNYAAHGMARQTSLNGIAILLHRQSELDKQDLSSVAVPNSPLGRLIEEARRTKDVFHADSVVQKEFGLTPFQTSDIMGRLGRRLIMNDPLSYVRQIAVNGVNLLCAPADGLTVLRTVLGPQPALDMTLSQAISNRNGLAITVQGGLRLHGLLFQGILPCAALLLVLWRPLNRSGALSLRLRRSIRSVPLSVWLLVVASGWCLSLSAAATITYGRFALPAIPLIAALTSLAAMQPRIRR